MSRKVKPPPRKPVWPIGATTVVTKDDGTISIIHPVAEHAGAKEEVERFFADIFVAKFNSQSPLGPENEITIARQNDTSDLDFSISSRDFDYLELAEATPINTDFGEKAINTGSVDVYEFSKWIWNNIIRHKEEKYGYKSARTLLMIYNSRSEFSINDWTYNCLMSTLSQKGCKFGAVFVMMTNGSDQTSIGQIYPTLVHGLPSPRMYKGQKYLNINFSKATTGPGYISFKFKMDGSEQI